MVTAIPDFASPTQGLDYWAATTPERIALSAGSQSLTFAELRAHVERRGHALRRASGSSPGPTFLPVLVDRSLDSCVSLLACHHARVPNFPVDRRTPPGVLADLVRRAGSSTSDLTSESDVDEEALGRIVFTSGSTGHPKGVALDWATMNARWRRRLEQPGGPFEGRRSTVILPLDSAWGLDVLAAVAAGYSLLVVDASRMRPSELVRRMAAFGTTHLEVPPQWLRVISELPDLDDLSLPDLQFLRVGSEALRFEFLAGIRRLAPFDAVVEHSYGATESAWVFRHRFPLGAAPEEGAVPLGEPAATDYVRLDPVDGLDDHVREVVVTGPIARGYIGDPEQTQARFAVDADGRRWWHSGDLVARSEDALYWHQGRLDDVVKVGGRLASPSQTMAVLNAIDGVRHSVVLPYARDHNVRLIAHVELEPGSQLTLDEVRRALEDGLPAHLVPSAVMRHRALPLTERGKVDRQAIVDGPFEPW